MSYCELHASSAFSFLRGGSFPEQLAHSAAELEMPAMALCDRNGVYGAQRFSVAARESGVRPIIGAELSMEGGGILPVMVENRSGYKNLCELLTQAHLRSEKGKCEIKWDELRKFAGGLVMLVGASLLKNGGTTSVPPVRLGPSHYSSDAIHSTSSGQAPRVPPRAIEVNRLYLDLQSIFDVLIQAFGRENVLVEIQRHFVRGEEQINRELVDLARANRVRLIATNGVQYAKPYGREVLDVFTCIREHTHLDVAGKLLTQ